MTTHPDARERETLAERLERAITTASNDDLSKPGTPERERHVARLAAMQEACLALRAPAVPGELRELSEKATAGPWKRTAIEGGWDGVRSERWKLPICKLVENHPVNAEFIAAAANYVRALLAAPATDADVRREARADALAVTDEAVEAVLDAKINGPYSLTLREMLARHVGNPHWFARSAVEIALPHLAPGQDARRAALEEAAKQCEERAAYFDRTKGHYDRKQAAGSYRATAKELRSLASQPAPSGQEAQPAWRPTHRHVKSSSLYEVLDQNVIDVTNERCGLRVVLYRGENGRQYVRDRREFEDGRFERLPTPHTNSPHKPAWRSETFDSIAEWCEQTFGPIQLSRIAERANEEMIELLAAPDKVEEAADVVIVLSRYPGLWDAVERKMAVNRQREWRLMGDGTGYHVSAPPPDPALLEQEG